MECKVCGKDYPSKYYFATESICKECYESMSAEEKKSIKNKKKEIERKEYINGKNQKTTYPALKTISRVYKSFAGIIGFLSFIGIIAGIFQLNSSFISKEFSISIIIISLIIGIIGVIAFLAISEVIKLLIDLGENSRRQSKLLEKFIEKDSNE